MSESFALLVLVIAIMLPHFIATLIAFIFNKTLHIDKSASIVWIYLALAAAYAIFGFIMVGLEDCSSRSFYESLNQSDDVYTYCENNQKLKAFMAIYAFITFPIAVVNSVVIISKDSDSIDYSDDEDNTNLL